MLAEIFLLRMEAIYRASEESAPTSKSRFVPITVPPSSPRLLWLTQQSRNFKDAGRSLRPEQHAGRRLGARPLISHPQRLSDGDACGGGCGSYPAGKGSGDPLVKIEQALQPHVLPILKDRR